MASGVSRFRAAAVVALLAVGFTAGLFADRMMSASPGATPSAQAGGGGFSWPFFGHPRAADAPRAAPPRPAAFAVWTTRLDTHTTSPSACIRMSRPLDASRGYGDFVSVSPDLGHPAAVTVNGDELCVADVGYVARTITLMRGLPAATGETLTDNVDVAFAPGSKPVYVGFVGEGVILPREDADGVGLETVNVSRLHIRVFRVADRNLVRKDISAPEPTGEGDYNYDGGDNGVGDDGRLIWEGDVAVRGVADQRATTVFPLGAVLKTLEPGAYVVMAADASGLKGAPQKDGEADRESPAQARRWILFTDMALQAYDGSDALDVTVRSLKSARPMGGVRLALVGKDGGDLASASTDGEGHVRFARALLAGEQGAHPARLMAYGPRGDFTVLDLERAPVDLSKQDVTGRTPPGGEPKTGKAAIDPANAIDGFVYADRGIYRPGETAHLVALLRDGGSRAVKDRRGALVLRRPSGLEFARYRFRGARRGAVTANVALPPGAPRGIWRVSLEMEGSDAASGGTSFDVEDFAPQRLAVTLAAAPERPMLNGEVRRVPVAARFLYGAPAAALAVRSEARVSADPDPFPAFKDFAWGDQQTSFPERLIEGPPSVTDGAGAATAVLDISTLGPQTSPLKAVLTASVFEPGGRPVSEEATLKLHLKPLYLGVRTIGGPGDEPLQTFEIIAVNAQGQRVAANAHYMLISESWNYDWFEQNGRWSWRRTSRDIPIAQGDLAIGAGAPARFSRKLPWGDYLLVLDDPATGAHTVIRQSAGWSAPSDDVEAPDSARVSPVRTDYKTGDTVDVHIQAPFAGEAEVAVATDHLIALRQLHLPEGGADFRMRADPAWGGGAYVLVSVVQPRDPVASPKPRRALGLAYVSLEPVGRKLTVDIGTPPKLDSRSPITVPLTVRGLGPGQTAHVTLAAVDEGILRLTHQKNPDPVDWYFGKRALSLAYRDDYGRLLDPNLGSAAAANFGGDEVGGAKLTAVPIRTVALWSGIVDTDAGGKATVRMPATDFNGQLRLVAVAWTDGAVGGGASDMIVRQPVVAELSLPRFLSPGDRAAATLELDNVEGKAGVYIVSIVGRNGPQIAWRHAFQLARGQRIIQKVDISAARVASVGGVGFAVRGPGVSVTRGYPLQIRPGWGRLTRASTVPQRPGEAYMPSVGLLAGMAAGDVSMTVSYSPFANFDPAPVAEALAHYPFGCSEQTTSMGAGSLYAPDLATNPKRQGALATSVGKLLDREALDGSFGLWRVGDGEADPWIGAYVTDFLLEAKASGALVPDGALQRALSAMHALSKPDGFSSVGYRMEVSPQPHWLSPQAARDQTRRLRSRAAAYALYDLAKAGQGDLARLRWFHDVGFEQERSPLARAQIGAALAAMGDRGRAHDSFVLAVAALGYRDPDDWYQSPLRDLAGVIALAYEAGETDLARGLQARLENTVRSPDALNTQEQAFLLKAAHAMAASAGPVRIQASGATPKGGDRWAVGRPADARFVNLGHGTVWRTVTVSGKPTMPPAARSSGIAFDKRVFGLDGHPVDPAKLKQGDRMIIRLAGRATAKRDALTVVDDALPAGFEIESALTPTDAQGEKDENGKAKAGPFAFLGSLSKASVQEKRDDRFIAALKLSGDKTFALAYVVRAVTPGNYFLPGAEAKDMYRPAVSARTASARTVISP
jgi:uncharacterized protein YfaS (alpha-2-macroglobulin family)